MAALPGTCLQNDQVTYGRRVYGRPGTTSPETLGCDGIFIATDLHYLRCPAHLVLPRCLRDACPAYRLKPSTSFSKPQPPVARSEACFLCASFGTNSPIPVFVALNGLAVHLPVLVSFNVLFLPIIRHKCNQPHYYQTHVAIPHSCVPATGLCHRTTTSQSSIQLKGQTQPN